MKGPRTKEFYQRPGQIPKVKRDCLRCGKEFSSEGPEHRICYPCKKTHDWRNPSLCSRPVGIGSGRTGKKSTSQH